jgi:hypothetical protein
VAPTAARVAAAVAASGRSRVELVAEMPPRLGRATVEKIAVNAVMAGCRPEYLPVVLAAIEAVCDERFCLLGVSGTTDAVATLVIVNGPIRSALDINSGAGVFGPGWRANATIGRALRLCSWPTRGAHHKAVGLGDPALAFSPGHVTTLAADGWSKARVRQCLWERLRKPVRELLPGHDGGEGLSGEALAVFPEGAPSAALVPRFQTPESLKLLVAGGPADRFTAIVPGWPFRNAPSRLVLRKIART